MVIFTESKTGTQLRHEGDHMMAAPHRSAGPGRAGPGTGGSQPVQYVLQEQCKDAQASRQGRAEHAGRLQQVCMQTSKHRKQSRQATQGLLTGAQKNGRCQSKLESARRGRRRDTRRQVRSGQAACPPARELTNERVHSEKGQDNNASEASRPDLKGPDPFD